MRSGFGHQRSGGERYALASTRPRSDDERCRPDAARWLPMGADAHAVLGVDGARGGWVGVRWDGRSLACAFATTLAGLVEDASPVAVVGVDMPIQLQAADRKSTRLNSSH